MRLVLDARTAAFASLIDYAGVFPPASLPMADAVERYRRLRSGDDRWVVGRFLCRASQLEELAAVATRGMTRGERPWSVGVIMDVSPGAAASVAHEFQREMSPVMEVTSAEVRIGAAPTVGALLDAVSAVDAGVAAFIEVDPEHALRAQMDAIGSSLRDRGMTGGAKIRCGGATPDAIPPVEFVSEFVWEASMAGVPFKATAGLHQPIRHLDEELGAVRHGFVNLLLGSVAADQGEDRATVSAIVAEEDSREFTIGPMAASWRHLSFPGSAVRRSRSFGFLAFGSCDADEPIGALRDLAFLGEGA